MSTTPQEIATSSILDKEERIAAQREFQKKRRDEYQKKLERLEPDPERRALAMYFAELEGRI